MTRLAVAAIAGSAAAIALYVVLRLASAFRGLEPDAAQVLWSAHAGYYWRSLTAGYGGGMIALAVHLVAPRDPARAARAASAALALATALLILQSVFVP
jgi:hypothetical protein